MRNELIWQLSNTGGVDLEATLNRFLDDEELYLNFLKDFLHDKSFEGIKRNLQTGNMKEAFANAHTMKGIAGNLGLQNLVDILTPMAEDLRNGTLNNSEIYMEDLSKQYTIICNIIHSI